jgi:hypothetical protein
MSAAQSEPFVPLAAKGGSLPSAGGGSRLKVLSQPAQVQPFKPLVHAQPGEAPLLAQCPRPTVTLKRDGDRVTHIRVQCLCGEVIEIACEY